MASSKTGKFHIGKSGPAPCEATVRDCGLEGSEHFDNEADAQVYYQKELAKEFDTISVLSRKKKDRSSRSNSKLKDGMLKVMDVLTGSDNAIKVTGSVLTIAVLAGGFAITQTATESEMSCVVTDKQVVLEMKKGELDPNKRKYEVSTQECGTLQLSGGITHFTTNAKDLYNSVKVGEAYTFKTTGLDTWFTNPSAYEANHIKQ